jgi:site-specific recombinase XerD
VNQKGIKQLNREAVERYRRWLHAQHYADSTETRYCRTALKLCRFIKDRPLRSITSIDIGDFLTRTLPLQWSEGTIAFQLQALRSFFDFLYFGGIVDNVAPRFLRWRSPVRRLPKALSQSRIKRLIAATDNRRDRAVIELLYATGCRVGEVVDIRVEQIDFAKRRLKVIGKRKERIVYFGSLAERAILKYLGQRRTGYLFQDINRQQKGYLSRAQLVWRGYWRDHRNGARYCKYLGSIKTVSYAEARRRLDKHLKGFDLERPKPDRPLTSGTLQRIVQEAGRRANLGRVNAHMLRHSFATHLLDKGADIRTIQILLGHTYLTSTQLYTLVSNASAASTFRRCHPRGA